jgi:hypothetical protein
VNTGCAGGVGVVVAATGSAGAAVSRLHQQRQRGNQQAERQ